MANGYASVSEIYQVAFQVLCRGARRGSLPLGKAKARIESAPGLIFHPPASSMEILRSMQSSGWLQIEEDEDRVSICTNERR